MLRGFERGADDYLGKPFSYPELRAASGRCCTAPTGAARLGRLRVGELEIDPPRASARLRGSGSTLSQKEFALLRTLATDPTRVFTKEELLRPIWGFRSLRLDADAGPPRVPAARTSSAPRRPVRGQRVGRRLPPRRRAGRASR